MIEFTKEELEVILGYIKEINRKYETDEKMDSIEIKVKAMLDDLTQDKIEKPIPGNCTLADLHNNE